MLRSSSDPSSAWSSFSLTGLSQVPALTPKLARLTPARVTRFEECLKLRQLVPIDPYQFPSPPLLKLSEYTSGKSFEARLADYFKTKALQPPKRSSLPNTTSTILGVLPGGNTILATRSKANEIYQRSAAVMLHERSASADAGASTSSSKGPAGGIPGGMELAESSTSIFENKIVYLASDLGLRPGLEEALKQRVEQAGGECWSWGVDGAQASSTGDQWDRRRMAEKALERANTVVTRKREGWEFWHVSAIRDSWARDGWAENSRESFFFLFFRRLTPRPGTR